MRTVLFPMFSLLISSLTNHSRFVRGFSITKTTHLRQQRVVPYSIRSLSKLRMATDTQDMTELKRLVDDAKDLLRTNLETMSKQNILEAQIADLEQESSHPDFWNDPNDPRTKKVNQELASKNKALDRLKLWEELSGECSTALELIADIKDDEDEAEMVDMMVEECKLAAEKLLEDGKKYELESLLNGKFDNNPARIVLTAGAGGTEACDWVDMLHRMYLRHAERMDYKAIIEETSAGDVVGYKSVEILVEGPNAYGWFRGEKGAHRLVRLSPFNANNKRQTTFAGVDVVPVLEDEDVIDIEIAENDLEITTMVSL